MTRAEQIKYNDLKAKYETEKNKNKQLEEKMEEYEKNYSKKLSEASKKIDRIYADFINAKDDANELKNKKKEYEKEIKDLKKKVSDLEEALLDKKASAIKNSDNSSKPSSSEPYKIANNREKSERNKGGQFGRKGKTMPRFDSKDIDKIINVYGNKQCTCGGKIIYTTEYVSKQIMDIISKALKLEYRYHKGVCEKCGKKYKTPIAKQHQNPVGYSSKVKSLIAVTKECGNVSTGTAQLLMKEFTDSEIEISTGCTHNIEREIAKKAEPIVAAIENELSNKILAHADETTTKIANKLGCCISFSADDLVLYRMYTNKSKESFDEFGIFKRFEGILVHDHNKMYYKYLSITHAECNVHVMRYLKYFIELFNRESIVKFREFLMSLYNEKLEATINGKTELEEDRVKEIEKEYLRLLEEWKKEFEAETQKYNKLPKAYKDEKNLFSRLIEYKEEHLLFIKNFTVPFSNNKAERTLRSIKIKMNVSKRFGTLKRAEDYATVKTIVETAKMKKVSVKEIFKDIIEERINEALSKLGLEGKALAKA